MPDVWPVSVMLGDLWRRWQEQRATRRVEAAVRESATADRLRELTPWQRYEAAAELHADVCDAIQARAARKELDPAAVYAMHEYADAYLHDRGQHPNQAMLLDHEDAIAEFVTDPDGDARWRAAAEARQVQRAPAVADAVDHAERLAGQWSASHHAAWDDDDTY